MGRVRRRCDAQMLEGLPREHPAARGARDDDLTGVIVLAWRPGELWSMGFQLSFGLVAALITMGPVMHRRLFGQRVIGGLERPHSGWRWALHTGWGVLRGLISVSVLCWLVAAGSVGSKAMVGMAVSELRLTLMSAPEPAVPSPVGLGGAVIEERLMGPRTPVGCPVAS